MILARRFRIVLVCLLMALPMIGLAPAAAQEQEFTPESYTSTLTPFEIEVAGPVYAITGATLEHYATGDGEIVDIESEWVTIEISFFDDADSPEQSIDAYIDGIDSADVDYTIVDRGQAADTTFAIIAIQYEGIDVLYYLQVTEDVVGNVDLFESILTTGDTFEDDFAAAQSEISIDGAPFMADIVGADLVASVANSADAATTPEVVASPAAPAVTVPFDAAGVDLGLSSDFEVSGDPVVDGSIQGYIVTGEETITLVAIGQTDMTAEETVQSFASSLDDNYDSVESIEDNVTADTAWSLFLVEVGGENRVMLVTADTSLVPGFEVLVSTEMPITAVAASMTDVQTGLSIDGQGLLANIDGKEIESLVGEATTEPTVQAAETPAATETTSRTTARPRDDAKIPAGAGNTSEVNGSPEATEEPVSQSDSSWEGPVLGHLVEWDTSTWFVDINDTEMVVSNEANQYDAITMTADFSPIVTLLYVNMYGTNASTPEEYLAYWSSDEFLRHQTSSGEEFTGVLVGSESTDGRAAVVISYTNSDGDFYLIREAVAQEGGNILLLTLDVPVTDVVTAYTAAQSGVSVDASPVFSVFTPAQIQTLTAE